MVTPGMPGNGGRLRRLRRATTMVALAWTLAVGASLSWNIFNAWENVHVLAAREARLHFSKDQAIRYWASRHGGVYVESDQRTPPNPALSHVPERDLTTPSGRRLTLMNPAYMLRQVMTEYSEQFGIRGRITSLDPINPDNAADAWEAAALRRFEAGEREVFEVADKDGEPHLRLMRAMMTEASCLKCHGHQGYRVGDVRGGVGVSVPLEPYFDLARHSVRIQSVSHGAIWLLGLGGISLVGRRFRAHTQAEMAEQARAEKLHRRLDLVLRAVNDGIVGIDRRGRIRLVNPAAAAMLGYETSELLERDLHETLHHARADGRLCSEADCPTQQSMRDGVSHQQVGELFRRKDGSLMPVEMITTPLVEDGQVVGGVVVFRDVSDRLAAERSSRELVEKLAQSNQDLQQFAYTVSHDLQEPLRMISSYVQLLGRRLSPAMDDDCREFIGYAVDGAARMSRMIADLVEFSRVESRGGPLEDVDAGRVIADAVANLSLAIEESHAQIQVAGPLPCVVGDASQLVRLFQNLIGNAVKFRSPDRPPCVRIGVREMEGMAEFSVADNGIGIPEEAFERIFQIFQRLHGRGEYDGTGIGLAIVRRTAERHGGRVWVESAPGEGSVFYVTLPLCGAT
ncbi:MAG TPA: ATP-binding protein [Magnetospirillum sp.]|nr:ATP-binding protein [Magnetospirillum sp.]